MQIDSQLGQTQSSQFEKLVILIKSNLISNQIDSIDSLMRVTH